MPRGKRDPNAQAVVAMEVAERMIRELRLGGRGQIENAARIIKEFKLNRGDVENITAILRTFRCFTHQKKLVCPTCEAMARGSKGGRARARHAAKDKRIAAAGKRGGRPRKRRIEMPPASLQTPMTET